MLRTRLEPEMDAEDAAAKAEWEEAHGTVTREKAEELSVRLNTVTYTIALSELSSHSGTTLGSI